MYSWGGGGDVAFVWRRCNKTNWWKEEEEEERKRQTAFDLQSFLRCDVFLSAAVCFCESLIKCFIWDSVWTLTLHSLFLSVWFSVSVKINNQAAEFLQNFYFIYSFFLITSVMSRWLRESRQRVKELVVVVFDVVVHVVPEVHWKTKMIDFFFNIRKEERIKKKPSKWFSHSW